MYGTRESQAGKTERSTGSTLRAVGRSILVLGLLVGTLGQSCGAPPILSGNDDEGDNPQVLGYHPEPPPAAVDDTPEPPPTTDPGQPDPPPDTPDVLDPASAVPELRLQAVQSDGSLQVIFRVDTVNGYTGPEGTYSWDFGDDTVATGKEVTHTYSRAAAYTVAVCLTLSSGLTISCSEQTVTVTAASSTPDTPPGGGDEPPPPPPAQHAPPVAHPITDAMTSQGRPLQLVLQGTDSEGLDLTFLINSSPKNGALSPVDNDGLDSASVTYTPKNDFAGSDSFTFTTFNTDGQQSPPATVTIQVASSWLTVTPAGGLVAAGPQRGPFVPSEVTYTLTNTASTSLQWSARTTANWLTLSSTSGTLTEGATAQVTASLNSQATALVVGTYQGTIHFSSSLDAAELPGKPVALTVSAGSAIPIARWDTVSYQRVNAGETLQAGVVAFSKAGIHKVEFKITGQGYTGPATVDVTSMSLNTATGVHEYWVPIRAGDFASDGPVTVEARVVGRDGGVRDKNTAGGGLGLDPLTVVVNPRGTLPQPVAWVDPSLTSDAGGAVNNQSKPFATVGKAADALRAWRAAQGLGNNGDGGIVRLLPGTHTCSNGNVVTTMACENEWLTITGMPGTNPEDTILQSGPGPVVRKIKVSGITLENLTGARGTVLTTTSADRAETQIWVANCRMRGPGRHTANANPLSAGYLYTYYTDTYIERVDFATPGGDICRGLTIEGIGNDAFQLVPLVVNCRANDIDPGNTGWHADAWQHFDGNAENRRDENSIVYNFEATNCKYQGIFIRPNGGNAPTHANGMALVNVRVSPAPGYVVWNMWYRWVDHMIMWNCTFDQTPFAFYDDSYLGVMLSPNIRNFSAIGNSFDRLNIPRGTERDIDFSAWNHNHFVITPGTPGSTYNTSAPKGTNFTIGNPGLNNGRPVSGSVLLGRLADPPVPFDLGGAFRQPPAAVGAYE